MNKHEEMRDIILGYAMRVNPTMKFMEYSIQAEATEKAHEELKRDVKRYFELNKLIDDYHSKAVFTDLDEYVKLSQKLTKVGDSNVD